MQVLSLTLKRRHISAFLPFCIRSEPGSDQCKHWQINAHFFSSGISSLRALFMKIFEIKVSGGFGDWYCDAIQRSFQDFRQKSTGFLRKVMISQRLEFVTQLQLSKRTTNFISYPNHCSVSKTEVVKVIYDRGNLIWNGGSMCYRII